MKKFNSLSPSRRAFEIAGRTLIRLCSGITVSLLIFLIGIICCKGIPNLSWTLISTEESILSGTVGILPAIINTVFVILVSLLIALPMGVGAAVYLTEYASRRRLVSAIEFATETLSGIPSIIYALVGVIIFCSALGLQKTLISGSLTLSIMVMPTIIRTTQESLKTVPQSYREAALGLGCGKWRMIRTVVLPSSMDGIVTGAILAIGRIVGESAVLLYTAGLTTSMQDFSVGSIVKASGATLSSALYIYAKERADMDTAFAIAFILLCITVIINLAAAAAGKKLKRQ